ncbi:chch-3, partial [Pristionchus pacificus]
FQAMGAGQSAETAPKPEVIRINREEIPEQYKTVGVSTDVVRRINAQNQAKGGGATSEEATKLKAELDRERAEKARLREEMAKLTELQARRSTGTTTTSLAEDIEDRKRIFDETVQRVEKQFFSYQRENVCSDNEARILECINQNRGTVLKCKPLAEIYEKCVTDFRNQVLSGK